MKKVTITINTDNDAFQGNPEQEVSRILQDVAAKLMTDRYVKNLMDINGNTVGTIEIEY